MRNQQYDYNKAKHNVWIFYGIYCTSVTYDIYVVAANKCDMFGDKIRLGATLDHITHQVEDNS